MNRALYAALALARVSTWAPTAVTEHAATAIAAVVEKSYPAVATALRAPFEDSWADNVVATIPPNISNAVASRIQRAVRREQRAMRSLYGRFTPQNVWHAGCARAANNCVVAMVTPFCKGGSHDQD